jgi:muramidase (phage lysozyme)
MDTPRPEEKEQEENTSAETSENKKEEKKINEAEKNDHDGKFYVVHGGTCVCDKAEDPTKEAKITVTSQNLLVLNDSDKKYAATNEDTTLDPPAATFGKCTLKPSSSGNMPCVPSCAPKWEKAYEKRKVMDKPILTEISTLQCMVGGKITIKKHGQTVSVVKEHAELSDPVQQMVTNPAVKIPKLAKAFPVVKSITLKSIEKRKDFKAIESSGKGVEKVFVRVDEACEFKANLKSGNEQLTSWVMYSETKKGEKLLVNEQVGASFKHTFTALGIYRIEGYGKPKDKEFEKGAYDKNYPDCSIDVEVIVNKLSGEVLHPKTEDTFTRKDGKKVPRLRQNFPAVFEAKFILDPNEEEVEKLKIYATDASGNILSSGTQTGNIFNFTPSNSFAQYSIVAEYTNAKGEVATQSFTGVTEAVYVTGITSNAEVVRPRSELTFSVTSTQYDKGNVLTAEEGQQVKWNLNGTHIGNGSSITIPWQLVMDEGKYVIEAYIKSANSQVGVGTNTDSAKDDWHFEVKKNDVLGFTEIGQPKVGKKTQLLADKFIMSRINGENVNWQIFGKQIQGPKLNITGGQAGKYPVVCKINTQKGVIRDINIVQAQIDNIQFIDSNGVEIKKASWGQKLNIWIKHKEMLDEDFMLQVFNDKSHKVIFKKDIIKYDDSLIPFELDSIVKLHAKGENTNEYSIKVDAPLLTATNEQRAFPNSHKLEITEKVSIFDAIIGEEDGSKRHTDVNYDNVSWFYAHTTGIKTDEELTIEVWQSIFGFDPNLKLNLKAKVNQEGVLKVKLDWNKIPKIKSMRTVYIQVKNKNGDTLYDADGKYSEATTTLLFTLTAIKMVENKAAVRVGTSKVGSKDNKYGVCENEARVRAFMRMLRVKEGTSGDSGYKKLFGSSDFTASPHNKTMDTHPDISIPFGNSSSDAAGAYQIMGATYNDPGFKANREMYNVNRFDEESQDKLCLVILKHNYTTERSESFFNPKKDGKIDTVKQEERKKFKGQKGDIIQLIIDNDIKKATLLSSLCWASLPDAPYGQQDPNYTFEDVKKIYDGFLKEETEAKSKEIKLKKGFLREFGYSDCIALNAPDGIVTYRIYQDGIIEKHIPKAITKGYEKKYKYIYHGSKNVQHEICTVDWEEIDNIAFSGTLKTIPKGYVSSEDFNISGVNQKHVYKYADGSIVASGDSGEGGGTTINKYVKVTGKAILVKMPDPLNYDAKGVKVKMTFENTIRKYMGEDHFAALIGALAECSYENVISEGSAMKDGTCFPSVSHVNGQSIDTDYFKDTKGILKQKEQQNLIDAFAKFGFNEMYFAPNMKFDKPSKKMKKFATDSHHKAHLHCGAKEIKILTIKEK